MEGKEIAKEMTRLTKLRMGETLSVRNYDLEIVNSVPAAEYESGRHASGVVGESGRPEVPVVVDPALAAALRPHQRKGVRFLWECVAGMRPFSGNGAILADAMGLGKTLQAITLIQCALKQSIHGVPLASKAVVVCPSSLVAGWKKEFRKWLGDQKCRPVAVTTGGKTAETAVRDFCLSSATIAPVLIISYEQFRKYAPLINGGAAAAAASKPAKAHAPKNKSKKKTSAFGKGKRKAGNDDDDEDEEDEEAEAAAEAAMAAARGKRKGCEVGLLVCDEGHRLKNSDGNQTIKALASCPCRRRVILTGTPIQNRLDEFFACCSFVNPDVLGPLTTFRRVFQTPIQRGRDRSATPVEQSIGEERSKELARLSTQFILRRTQRILDKYLPPKTESCVFCQPTEQQLRLYSAVLAGAVPRGAGGGATAEALRAIGLLRQLCNSPALLWATAVRDGIAAGEDGAKELFETTTLRQTAAAVVAAMHRQMGVQGGSGGQSSSNHRAAPSLMCVAAKTASAASVEEAEDEAGAADDECDSLGSLEDFIVTDGDGDDAIDIDKEDVEEISAGSGSAKTTVRPYKAPLHAKKRSALSAFGTEWHRCPDPMRAALLELGCLADDGKSVAAGRQLPLRTGDASSIPRCFQDAGDVLSSSSGKMQLLDAMIQAACFPPSASAMAAWRGDKMVIVSNYTSALDVIAQLCCCRGVPFLRLDGSTTSDKRAGIVAAFNAPSHPSRVLLLSSRAGGVGLNLIGANRLVLFDVDWNPATDRQAMARVWRDGQKKRCAIYRFALAGTLEEKVLQRQLLKEEVSSAIVDGDTGAARSFSADELRRLFDPPTTEALGTCTTYALLNQQKRARGTVAPRTDAAAETGGEGEDDVASAADPAEEVNGEDEGEGAEDNGLSSWGVYEGAETVAEDDDVLAASIRLAGNGAVSYAQCTWFNKPADAAAADRPAKRGLDGVVRAAPAAAAIAEAVPVPNAAVVVDAETATPSDESAVLGDHTSSPLDAASKRGKPADAGVQAIMTAILSGDAAPAL